MPISSPSCDGLGTTDCGGVDPCLTVFVPGGSFRMGRDARDPDAYSGGGPDEVPAHSVTVSPYLLDVHEVTVARFRRFVESYDGVPPSAGAGEHPMIRGSGWQVEWNGRLPVDSAALKASFPDAEMVTWSDDPGSGECRPINYVSWYVAFAFCIWDDGRLPSEAEWEFAAAGGSRERLFPWGGAAPDNTRAVFGCSASGSPDCTAGDIPRVGSRSPRGDGRFGHADLAGSLNEFVRDQYDVGFYSLPQATGSDVMNLANDPLALESVVRGGDYIQSGEFLRGASRGARTRSARNDQEGIRCARDP
jgi:formylglycine-generating enzyme required for sulfatase activity